MLTAHTITECRSRHLEVMAFALGLGAPEKEGDVGVDTNALKPRLWFRQH